MDNLQLALNPTLKLTKAERNYMLAFIGGVPSWVDEGVDPAIADSLRAHHINGGTLANWTRPADCEGEQP